MGIWPRVLVPFAVFTSSNSNFAPAGACTVRVIYITSSLTVERSEEHTSELQSQSNIVCRLLLEKKTTNSPSEKRLEELREQAWKEGVVAGKGVDVAGGPIPRTPGYYGQPVVKPPVWTWEVPLYF